MKKILQIITLILLSANLFAVEKDYKNVSVNNGFFYTGKVSIYPGEKQYHNIWEIQSNSVIGVDQQIIIKCISKTKAYMNYKSTEKDDSTQFIVNENCEFLAYGKISDKWIYIYI